MTGTVDQLAYPLLLAAHGVPPWLLTIGFGHSDMYWYRVIERLGRNSLVGTTVRDAAQLPAHLVADEHHADWAGQKGYIPRSRSSECGPSWAGWSSFGRRWRNGRNGMK